MDENKFNHDSIKEYFIANADDLVFIDEILDRADMSDDEKVKFWEIFGKMIYIVSKDVIVNTVQEFAKITASNIGRLDYDVKGETYGRNPLS